MVSKILKKTPAKQIKERLAKRIKRATTTPPVKSSTGFSSIVAATINTCHRRLVKIFSKFSGGGIGGSPIKKSPKKQYSRIIPGDCDLSYDLDFHPRRPRPLQISRSLLPQTIRRTIFLDLDETLIHSKPDPPIHKYDFIVRPEIDGVKVGFYVTKRPFVDEFLKTLSEKFELVIFTAGLEQYASLVLEMLDTKAAITHRLYRNSCTLIDGKFVKDLESSGRDLSRSLIVDDNPNSYSLQPENGIPIAPFTGEVTGDVELLRLLDFFKGSDCYLDMRDAVKQLDLKKRW